MLGTSHNFLTNMNQTSVSVLTDDVTSLATASAFLATTDSRTNCSLTTDSDATHIHKDTVLTSIASAADHKHNGNSQVAEHGEDSKVVMRRRSRPGSKSSSRQSLLSLDSLSEVKVNEGLIESTCRTTMMKKLNGVVYNRAKPARYKLLSREISEEVLLPLQVSLCLNKQVLVS
jgi:hypothetical protein